MWSPGGGAELRRGGRWGARHTERTGGAEPALIFLLWRHPDVPAAAHVLQPPQVKWRPHGFMCLRGHGVYLCMYLFMYLCISVLHVRPSQTEPRPRRVKFCSFLVWRLCPGRRRLMTPSWGDTFSAAASFSNLEERQKKKEKTFYWRICAFSK